MVKHGSVHGYTCGCYSALAAYGEKLTAIAIRHSNINLELAVYGQGQTDAKVIFS